MMFWDLPRAVGYLSAICSLQKGSYLLKENLSKNSSLSITKMTLWRFAGKFLPASKFCSQLYLELSPMSSLCTDQECSNIGCLQHRQAERYSTEDSFKKEFHSTLPTEFERKSLNKSDILANFSLNFIRFFSNWLRLIYKISLRTSKCQSWGFIVQGSIHRCRCCPQLSTSASPLLRTSVHTNYLLFQAAYHKLCLCSRWSPDLPFSLGLG